jgi:DNA-binding MarR family transcriptional regulator
MRERKAAGSVQSDDNLPPVGDRALSFDQSVGYQIRITHRLIERQLYKRIQKHGVSLGAWYFLRVLWQEDGLTQRELSQRLGMKEPSALGAIREMSASGLVKRVADTKDRRKINIYLTERGRLLEDELLPVALEMNRSIIEGLSDRESAMLIEILGLIQNNMRASPEGDE